MAISTRRNAVPPQPDRIPCDPDLIPMPDFSSALYDDARRDYKRTLSNLDDAEIKWFMEQTWRIWTAQAKIWWNTYGSSQASQSHTTPAPHSASVDPTSAPVAVAGPSSAVDHGAAANQAQASSGSSLVAPARSPVASRPPSPIPNVQVVPPAPAFTVPATSVLAHIPAPIPATPAAPAVPPTVASVVAPVIPPRAPVVPIALVPNPPAAAVPVVPNPDIFQFGPDLLQDRRSTHVLHPSIENRLRKLQHVPLFHFTTRGLKNQLESHQQSIVDNSYHFEVVNGASTLVPASSAILSKKVPSDELLDLHQFREAHLNFLEAIRNAQWPLEVVDMWDDFFHNMLSHPSNLNPPINGQHPLMVYLARIRTMWHNDLEKTNSHPYINRVDETMFNQILQELQAAQHQKQVNEINQLMASTTRAPSLSNPLPPGFVKPSLFARVQVDSPPFVPSALALGTTTFSRAHVPKFGTVPSHPGVTVGLEMPCSIRQVGPFAFASSSSLAAPNNTPTFTSALDAVLQVTGLSDANSLRNSFPFSSPYNPSEWHSHLCRFGLLSRYPTLVASLYNGFHAGVPSITESFCPSNSASLYEHQGVFDSIVSAEFAAGRYFGPFTRSELEAHIGPFQSSPLSLVAKPSSDKFRLVQNLSFPYKQRLRSPSSSVSSIYSHIDSDLFPCTWGTFLTASLLILHLPPGSQGSCRDVADAFRTIPMAPDQWPGIVVRLSESDQFALNNANCFGLSSAGGVWGLLADAFCDILSGCGIGPIIKWVDDFLFLRILRSELSSYNKKRSLWADKARRLGRLQVHSRFLFLGDFLPDGRLEEFSDNMEFPLQSLEFTPSLSTVLPSQSPSAASSTIYSNDSLFAYSASHVDQISLHLGVPWKHEKTTPFAFTVTYLGFLWDLESKTVSLSDTKSSKYKSAIQSWHTRKWHTLKDVQELYGKLLHASHVLPAGRAYLFGLESMLPTYGDRPDCPHRPARSIRAELEWWTAQLSSLNVSRRIPSTDEFPELHAYSDASSGVGIGLFQLNAWGAYRLRPGWKKDGREIAWAEARSLLRPNVPAKLRLKLWKPSLSSVSSSVLPPTLQNRVVDVLAVSLQDSTLQTYGSGLAQFHRFCDDLNISEELRAPCSPDLLAGFIASLAGSYSASSIANYIAGIRAWHVLHRVPWNINEIELRSLLRGASSLTPETSKRPLREPYTPTIISSLRRQLDLSLPLDAAVFACLTTSFYACARLGEFTVPSQNGFLPHLHVKPSDVSERADRQGRQVRAFALPSTKTAPDGEEVFWAAQDGPTDPLAAFQNHLEVNSPPSDGPLFAYRSGDSHMPLSKTVFLKCLERAAKNAGLKPLHGHSIRIGSTLEYLLRGVPFDVVKAIGRWASDAFSLYLRKHAQILAPYLQAVPEVHDQFVRLTMPPPR
ncbi:hypothetical protein ACEPAI_5611 [Sanghuangporus weigelae]